MRTPYYREQALEGIAREVITAYDPNLYYGVPRMIPIEDIIEAQGITLEYQCLRKTAAQFELFICLHVTPRGHICQVLFGRAGLILDIHAKTYFKYAQLCKKPQRKRGISAGPAPR